MENEGDALIESYVRKNVIQAVLLPATLNEVQQRVFSHIAEIKEMGAGSAVLFLESDKYRVYLDETVQLNTANSINSSNFSPIPGMVSIVLPVNRASPRVC